MDRAREGLQKLVVDAIRRAPAAEAPILGWPLACGATVAARTRALSYADGVLNVEVPDALWRTELVSLVPKYLATLNQFAKVKRIEFVTVKEAAKAMNNLSGNRRSQSA
ncbi:MAG: DUF721 domain-containing protein [Terriglobales bacterium]